MNDSPRYCTSDTGATATNLNLNKRFIARTVHKCMHIIVHNCSSHIHCVSKNVPPLACYNFDTYEPILIFFVLLRALPGKTRKQENCIFHSNARIQPVAAWFLQSFWLDSRLILTLLCMTPQILQWMRPATGTVGAWIRRKEVQSAPADRLCCTHNAPVRCLLGFLFRKVVLKH